MGYDAKSHKVKLLIYMLGLGKEREAMSEAASAVYPDHLHSPRR